MDHTKTPTLACIHLNKRFNSSKHRDRFASWLHYRSVDMVLAQDPWPTSPAEPTAFADYIPLGGNRFVFSWTRANNDVPPAELLEEFCQRIDFGNLAAYNVYLSTYSADIRATQLDLLKQHLKSSAEERVLIVGCFNIAPEPGDGLVGGTIGLENNAKDRGALHDLIHSFDLLDLGRGPQPPNWTLERQRVAGKIQYRCDLALISRAIAPTTTFTTDHTTRRGQKAFTDHSGLLITPPIPL